MLLVCLCYRLDTYVSKLIPPSVPQYKDCEAISIEALDHNQDSISKLKTPAVVLAEFGG